MNDFGEKIRELRTSKGYSLRTLAPMVGVGFTYLSKVERGKLDFGESPSASLIQRLSEVLGANEDELMLMAHRIPQSISSRIFQQPDVFRKLVGCDETTLENFVRTLPNTQVVERRHPR